jgi:hypothetical protein
VRSLLADASLDLVHEALLTLAKHGSLELRPGSGTEFMTAEDLALCPPGPRGTSFVYARWIEAKGR